MGPKACRKAPKARATLREKLTGLALGTVRGRSSSPMAAFGVTCAFEPNGQGITKMKLSVRGKIATLALEGGGRPVKLRFGHGRWVQGTAVIGREPEARPAAGSYAWTSPDTWHGELWGYTSPYRNSYQCRFAGDTVTFTTEQNVGFGETRNPPIAGRILARQHRR
jgi:hypothetical protein